MLTGPLFKYLSGGLAIALLIFIGLWKMEQRRGDKFERRVTELTELRKSDRASYEAAQREAKAKNEAEVARIEARQKEITDNAKDSYARDLAELRRLRSQTRAPGSAPGRPGVSVVPETTGGADGAARVCVPESDALRSAETELRLLHLQRWLREQTGVAARP